MAVAMSLVVYISDMLSLRFRMTGSVPSVVIIHAQLIQMAVLLFHSLQEAAVIHVAAVCPSLFGKGNEAGKYHVLHAFGCHHFFCPKIGLHTDYARIVKDAVFVDLLHVIVALAVHQVTYLIIAVLYEVEVEWHVRTNHHIESLVCTFGEELGEIGVPP